MNLPENNKRIMLLGTQILIGGAQRILMTQADWFHRQGYEVSAVFFYDQQGLHAEWQQASKFTIYNLNAWRADGSRLENTFRLAVGMCRLIRLFLRKKYLAVETFTPHSNLLGLPVAWLFRVPIRIATHHGPVENLIRWETLLHRLLINSSLVSKMVAVSEYVREYAETVENIHPGKIEVIPNGITSPRSSLDRAAARAYLNDKWGVDPAINILLSVGRLRIQKGYSYLLDAAPAILGKYPNTVFLIAGEGSLRADLMSKVKALGLQNAVVFLGNSLEVPTLLKAADIFVFPSLWEGQPLALLEALDAGCPIVATNIAPIAFMLGDYPGPRNISPGDSRALADAILYLLADEGERERLAAIGKKLVGPQSAESMYRQYERLLIDLTEQAAGGERAK